MPRKASTPAAAPSETIDQSAPAISDAELRTFAATLSKILALAGSVATPATLASVSNGAREDETQDPPADDDLDGKGDGLDDDLDDAPKGPTIEDARAVLKQIVASKGKEMLAKILAKFGGPGATLPQIDPSKFADLIECAKRQLAK